MPIARRHILAIALVTVLAVLAIGAPRRAAAFDYVANGSFEFGGAGWIVSPSANLDVVDASVVPVQEGAHSGRIVLRPGASSFSIRQPPIDGAGPGVYRFTAWVRTSSRSTNAYAEVGDSGTTNSVRFEAAGEPDVWIELAGEITVTPSSAMAIAIGGRGEPGDVLYVDGVRLEGAPPVTPAATSPWPGEATATLTPTSTKTPLATATTHATDTPTPAVVTDPIGPELRNGGFEAMADDGSPASWEKHGGMLSSTISSVHAGTHAARLQSDTESTKWLYQTVSVAGGDWYIFGAWILDDDANVRSASLRVSWYASDDGNGSALASVDSSTDLTSPANEYRFLSTGGVAAPSDARSARLRVLLAPVSAITTSVLVDDATFGPSDPPADGAAQSSSGGADGAEGSAPAARLVLGEARAPQYDRAESNSSRSSTTAKSDGLLLSEVMYDPIGSDDAEWVELYNTGGVTISLAGWSLADTAGGDMLSAGQIEPHEFVVIAASDRFSAAFPDFSGTLIVLNGNIGNRLGNAGDRLLLRDPAGAVIDAISWGDDTGVLDPAIAAAPAGHSIERRSTALDTDSAADWIDNMHPSPGAAFVPTRAEARGKPRSTTTQTLGAGERSLSWLPWGIAGASAVGLLAVLSWRAAPFLSERLRRHA